MAFYYQCPRCGANLDPGEKCDCQEERTKKVKETEKRMPPLKVEKGGQLKWVGMAS